jgi:8-oxo-dGTP diphosphatase
MAPLGNKAGFILEVGQPQGVVIIPAMTELRQLLIDANRDGVQKVLAGAVIRRGHEILLVERVPEDSLGGWYELPSGHVDPGESLLDGLVREVKEETGLKISQIEGPAGSFDYKTRSGKLARPFNFAVMVYPPEIKLNPEEHTRFVWCGSKLQLESLKISSESRQIVTRVMGWNEK